MATRKRTELSSRAKALLLKIDSGQSYMAHIDIWEELERAGLVRWSERYERTIISPLGKKVRKQLSQSA